MSYSAKQKKVKVTLEGKEMIVKRLKSMGEGAQKVLEKAASEGGEIALSYAKSHCPVDTGALKQSLKLTVDKVTNTRATVKVDYDKSLSYGVYVELGAQGRKPNPFLRNSVDSNQNSINNTVGETVADEVGGRM